MKTIARSGANCAITGTLSAIGWGLHQQADYRCALPLGRVRGIALPTLPALP